MWSGMWFVTVPSEWSLITLAPHDLRRTCAKLCHINGGELEQIQFLLGNASVLTTERYLGCKQNLEEPVNARFGCLFSRTLDSCQALKSSIEDHAKTDRRPLADLPVLIAQGCLSRHLSEMMDRIAKGRKT